jgi:hypothetical protein
MADKRKNILLTLADCCGYPCVSERRDGQSIEMAAAVADIETPDRAR